MRPKLNVLVLYALTVATLLYSGWVGWTVLRMRSDGASVYLGARLVVKQASSESPLRAGDVLLAIGGKPVHEEMFRPDAWLSFLAEQPDEVPYTIERDGRVLTVTVRWYPVKLQDALLNFGGLLFIGFGVLLTNLLILPWHSHDRGVRRLVLTFVVLALNQVNNLLPTAGANVLMSWMWLFVPLDLSAWLIGPLGLEAFLRFPEEKAALKRYPRLPLLLYVSTPLAALVGTVILGDGTFYGTRNAMFIATDSVSMVLMALSIVAVAHTYITSRRPGVRNQIRWILWGLTLAFVPWLLLYGLPKQFTGVPFLPLSITNLTVTLIPISFAIAIFRFRLMEVDQVINRTMVYLILLGAVFVLYLSFYSLMRELLYILTGRSQDFTAGLLATLTLYAVLNPLREAIQRLIDRTFYRDHLDFDMLVREMGQELSAMLVFDDVLDLLTRQAALRLGLNFATILRTNESGQFVPVREAPIPSLPAASPLLAWARFSSQPLILHETRRVPPLVRAEALALNLRGAEVCIPLRHRQELLGLYVFGSKTSGNLLTRQELNSLITLSQQAAATLQNARLYQELETYSRGLEARVAERTAELREERNRLETILENLADGLLVTDTQGQLLLINPALQHMFPNVTLAAGQMLSTALPRLAGLVHTTLNAPESLHSEDLAFEWRPPAGAPVRRVYRATACALRDRNEGEHPILRGVIIIVRDITHESEVDRMKTEFISTVSHELRTPLTSILGFAKLIAKTYQREVAPVLSNEAETQRAAKRIEENLHIIISEGERLTRLINDVLDIAKMEAGKIEWHMESVALADVVRSAVAATASLAEEKQLTVELTVADTLPRVWGDRDRLVQVVTNLLSNAIKFTPQGRIQVNGECFTDMQQAAQRYRRLPAELTRPPLAQAPWIILSVRDSGIGIAEEDLGRIFHKFQQVGDLAYRTRGTGLGLTICKEIVEHHGGYIWVDSEPGQGSTFSFALPVPAGSAQAETSCAVTLAKAPARRHRILVIDDEEHILTLLHHELSDAGYEVLTARSGEEGLRSIPILRPDLILTDLMMPDVSGYDVVRRIKEDAATQHIPVVVLSVLEASVPDRPIAADAHLTKPVDIEELVKVLERLLNPGVA